jgi:type II secretory pathway pseudopilin PulG
MSQVPPPQPPFKPQTDNTGAVVAAAGVGSGVIAVIIVAVVAFFFFALCVIGILIALLLPAIQAAREAARRNGSMNNVKQLSLAMLNYEATFQEFPPQYSLDSAGQPALSWRALLLPYMEQQMLYDQLVQDESWNSAANSTATDTHIPTFVRPGSGSTGNLTDYVAIAGDGFLFNGNNKNRMANVADGSANTIFVVEVANSDIAWAEPRDLTMDDLQLEAAGAASDTPNLLRSMTVVGFVDGSVKTIPISDPEELRKLLTINAGDIANSW